MCLVTHFIIDGTRLIFCSCHDFSFKTTKLISVGNIWSKEEEEAEEDEEEGLRKFWVIIIIYLYFYVHKHIQMRISTCTYTHAGMHAYMHTKGHLEEHEQKEGRTKWSTQMSWKQSRRREGGLKITMEIHANWVKRRRAVWWSCSLMTLRTRKRKRQMKCDGQSPAWELIMNTKQLWTVPNPNPMKQNTQK